MAKEGTTGWNLTPGASTILPCASAITRSLALFTSLASSILNCGTKRIVKG